MKLNLTIKKTKIELLEKSKESSKSKLIYNHRKYQMLKNADSKSGFRRRGSQRLAPPKASLIGKENRFPSNLTDAKNKSLRVLSKRKTDRTLHNSKRDPLRPVKRKNGLQARTKRRSNGNFNSKRRMDLSCFENINLNSERRDIKAKKDEGGKLTYTRQSSIRERKANVKRRIHKIKDKMPSKENIYEFAKEMKRKDYNKSRHSINGTNQSIYEKIDPNIKQGEWNYQSMKNVFKANSPEMGSKMALLNSQNFQTLNPNPMLRSQEAKKRLQRASISKLSKKARISKVSNKENQKKLYNKIFSKKEIESFVKGNNINKQDTNEPKKRKNNLDEFFRNLELRSEKPLKPRPGSNLINQMGKRIKHGRGSSKNSKECMTSLGRKTEKTFESVEKMMFESKNKKKDVVNIFETIYKDKPRPNSKNNNRRRKSSRTSGNSQGVVWGNGRREDSIRNYKKISKWIKNEKKMKTECLDIENSLYCKENLKRMGQNQDFNVPNLPNQTKNLLQPSTKDGKNEDTTIVERKLNQVEVKISSFFKESRNNSEKEIRNSKAIKEETPEIQKQHMGARQKKINLSRNNNKYTKFNQFFPLEEKTQKLDSKTNFCQNENRLQIEDDDSEANFSRDSVGLQIESPSKSKKGFFPNIPQTYQFERNFKDILSHHIDKIISHLHIRENKCNIKEDYFKKKQKQVDSKMREVLVDWLIEVHNRYKMRDETIFLAVRLIDKYLSIRPIEYDRFQLLGTASLMIAAKYEEIYPPKVKDFVYICANAYTRADVLKMEARILHLMNFDLVFPTSIQFFGFFQKLFKFEPAVKNLTFYILYGSLICHNFTQTNPRLLAYSAVIMANKAFKNYDGIKEFKANVPGNFKDSEVNLCIFQIYNMLLGMKKSELSALRTRFSAEKYGNVAQIQQRVH
jgi:cyclin B